MTEISSTKVGKRKLKEGDLAPDFSGLDQDGKKVALSDFRGKNLVLYFYPKDNTPTCTTQSCNLRDNYGMLRKKGFEILGVSADSPRKHGNFIRKYKLPFRLLADVDKEVINAYGVWGRKKLFGIEFDGILRTTFVINRLGVITNIIDKVESASHSRQILEVTGH